MHRIYRKRRTDSDDESESEREDMPVEIENTKRVAKKTMPIDEDELSIAIQRMGISDMSVYDLIQMRKKAQLEGDNTSKCIAEDEVFFRYKDVFGQMPVGIPFATVTNKLLTHNFNLTEMGFTYNNTKTVNILISAISCGGISGDMYFLESDRKFEDVLMNTYNMFNIAGIKDNRIVDENIYYALSNALNTVEYITQSINHLLNGTKTHGNDDIINLLVSEEKNHYESYIRDPLRRSLESYSTTYKYIENKLITMKKPSGGCVSRKNLLKIKFGNNINISYGRNDENSTGGCLKTNKLAQFVDKIFKADDPIQYFATQFGKDHKYLEFREVDIKDREKYFVYVDYLIRLLFYTETLIIPGLHNVKYADDCDNQIDYMDLINYLNKKYNYNPITLEEAKEFYKSAKVYSLHKYTGGPPV